MTAEIHRLFRSLRHRNFRIFWYGQAVSLLGTWMQTTAQAWLVLEITGSAFKLGVVTALQFLPILLLSLFTGPLIDRFPKRRTIIITQSVLAIQPSSSPCSSGPARCATRIWRFWPPSSA